MRLAEKAAIVTGAGMGIGRATARLFAAEGAGVVVVDYDPQGGQETAALIRADGGEAIFAQADVSDPDAVQAMVRAAIDRYGRIDVLHNNAGIDLPQATNVVETGIEDWDRTLAVNLKGVFLCCKAVIPEMVAQGGGVIVNTASVAGLAPMPQEAAYGASKAGLLLLTRQMARDYARRNIRVNSVSPGPMEKPTRHRLAYLQEHPAAFERRQTFAQRMPLGRMCRPEDIARAALFLASDEASMITGADLVVDGGFLLG
ncbi:MAG: SDR family NAD(P)-dependent oxidoreductase [Chloroflexota bacterium]